MSLDFFDPTLSSRGSGSVPYEHLRNGFMHLAPKKQHAVQDLSRSDTVAFRRPEWFGLRPWFDWALAVIHSIGQYLQRRFSGTDLPWVDRIRPIPESADFEAFSQYVHQSLSFFNGELDRQIQAAALIPAEDEARGPATERLLPYARSLQKHVNHASMWMHSHQEEVRSLVDSHKVTTINRELMRSTALIGAAIRLAPHPGLVLQPAPEGASPLTEIGIPLLNPNVKCFINSTLQCFFMIPLLRKYVIDRDEQHPTIRRHAFRYFNHNHQTKAHGVEPPRGGYNLSEIVHVLGRAIREEPHRQHDAQEAIAALFEPFNPALEIEIGNPLFYRMQLNLRLDMTPLRQHGTDCLTREELDCFRRGKGDYASAADPISILPLQFNGASRELQSIESMIWFYCNSVHTDPEYRKNVTIIHPEEHVETPVPLRITEELRRFITLPDVLLLQLKRFKYSSAGVASKNEQLVDYPSHFIVGGPDYSQNPDEYAEYRNIGFIQHRGGVSGGHYFFVIHDAEANQWYKVDDLPGFGMPSSIIPIEAEEAHRLREKTYVPINIKVRTVSAEEGRAAMRLRKQQVKERELRMAIEASKQTAAAESPEGQMRKAQSDLVQVELFGEVLSQSSSSQVLMELFANLPQDFKNFCITILNLEKGYTKDFEILSNLSQLTTILTKYVDTEVSRNVVAQYLYLRKRYFELKEKDIAQRKAAIALISSDRQAEADLAALHIRLERVQFAQEQLRALSRVTQEKPARLPKVAFVANLMIPELQDRLTKRLSELVEEEATPTLENYQAAVEGLLKDVAQSEEHFREEITKIVLAKEEASHKKSSESTGEDTGTEHRD